MTHAATTTQNIGVYKITNAKTSAFYIGGSTNIARRKINHFSKLRHGKHHNSRLQEAFIHDGESFFSFEVLEYCTKEELLLKEQFFITFLEPAYNISIIAGGAFRKGFKMSLAEREHLSKVKTGLNHSDETKEKLRLHNVGKKHCEETLQKLSNISKNSWASVEYRKKVQAAKKLNWAQDINRKQALSLRMKEYWAKRRKINLNGDENK